MLFGDLISGLRGKKKIKKETNALSKLTVEDLMVQLSYMALLSSDYSVSDVLYASTAKGRRIRYLPVLDSSGTQIEYYIDGMEVIANACGSSNDNNTCPDYYNITRYEIMCFPGDCSAINAAKSMYHNFCKISVVVDELAHVIGVVTFEDCMGVMLAEDAVRLISSNIVYLLDGSIAVSGQEKISKIEAILSTQIDITCGEVKTIGGLVMFVSGDMPRIGQPVVIPGVNIEIEVVSIANQKIKKLKIRKPT